MQQESNKLLTYVIDEDQHLNNLQKIITRDFFPALARLKQQPNTQPIPEISLNAYHQNFTSQENVNFARIAQANDREFREKHWWMNHQLMSEETKQLKLMASETGREYARMLEGSRNNNLAITAPAEPTNALFFNDGQSLVDKEIESYDKHKRVVFENTRFVETDRPLEYAATKLKRNSDYVLDTKLPSTPILQGILDQELKKNQKYQLKGNEQFARPTKKRIVDEVGGYKVLTLPSPTPNTMQSPLMTYGEIEDAPERLREYRMPQTPQRDQLLEKLNKKMMNKKQEQQSRKESTVMRLLGNCTPTALKNSSLLKSKGSSSIRKVPSTVRQPNQLQNDTSKPLQPQGK